MVLVVCGLNYRTAPLPVREQAALLGMSEDDWLKKLTSVPHVKEAMILSTCNRSEIYCSTSDPDALLQWLTKEYQLAPDGSCLYLHQEDFAVQHLLRVASGLDSMVVGEAQILGQMKQAYQRAYHAGAIKTKLRSVFEYVFGASKRIRTQSGIGAHSTSIASTAAQLIVDFFKKKSHPPKVFLIGSGETAALVAKYLNQHGISDFLISSRTQSHAQRLAQQFQGTAIAVTDIPLHLSQADVVVSATSCPVPFINATMVLNALQQRDHSPMFFLDLSIPRDIEPQVGALEHVQLVNVDELQHLITQNLHERHQSAAHAEKLLQYEWQQYIRRQRTFNATDAVCNYRGLMADLAQQELDRALKQWAHGEQFDVIVQSLCQRLVNKLTHHATSGLKQMALDNREDLLDLAQYLLTKNHATTDEEFT